MGSSGNCSRMRSAAGCESLSQRVLSIRHRMSLLVTASPDRYRQMMLLLLPCGSARLGPGDPGDGDVAGIVHVAPVLPAPCCAGTDSKGGLMSDGCQSVSCTDQRLFVSTIHMVRHRLHGCCVAQRRIGPQPSGQYDPESHGQAAIGDRLPGDNLSRRAPGISRTVRRPSSIAPAPGGGRR